LIVLDYTPQPRQKLLHETPATFILYGGAAGGAKSHGLRWDLYGWCLTVPGIDCFLFRKTLPELEANHIRKMRAEIPGSIATYNESRKRLEFLNGSGLNMCFCETDDDVVKYQGSEMHVFAFDEAALAKPDHLAFLLTRNRLGGFQERIPPQYRHLLPRAVFSSNPGGPAHNFLKENFIDPAPAETVFLHPLYRRKTIFIPSSMKDNKYLDTGYENQFVGLPEERRKALVEGDWDAIVGQALPIDRSVHMIGPFKPPPHWTKFMAMDWGTARPFSVGWYCVSEGTEVEWKIGNWGKRYLPAGSVIRYREWYGWNGKANHGCRMESPAVAKKILEIENGENIDYRIADGAMWAKTDGPSPAERMLEATDGRLALRSTGAKDRKMMYAECIARLMGQDGHPMFFATSDCKHFWRTVPVLITDEIDPDKGPDTKMEDHVYDEWSYAMRSRPFIQTKDDRWYQENYEDLKNLKPIDPYAT